jgi:hypothetical protein
LHFSDDFSNGEKISESKLGLSVRFSKWGPNRRNQSSLFFAQEPEKKASLIQKLGLNSKNHKYHFGKKWLMEINSFVGLKIE